MPWQHLARVEDAVRVQRGLDRAHRCQRFRVKACAMKSRLARPMPCSPDNVPPNASVSSKIWQRGMRARVLVGIVRVVRMLTCGCRC